MLLVRFLVVMVVVVGLMVGLVIDAAPHGGGGYDLVVTMVNHVLKGKKLRSRAISGCVVGSGLILS